jgi:hypothetical protein
MSLDSVEGVTGVTGDSVVWRGDVNSFALDVALVLDSPFSGMLMSADDHSLTHCHCGDLSICCSFYEDVGGCASEPQGTLEHLILRYQVPLGGAVECDRSLEIHQEDDVLSCMFLDLTLSCRGWLGEVFYEANSFISGHDTTVAEWGSGYCYMNLIPAHARLVVGRILGTSPLVVDVLRVVKVIGLDHGSYRVHLTDTGLHLLAVQDSVESYRDMSLRAFYTLVIMIANVDQYFRFG